MQLSTWHTAFPGQLQYEAWFIFTHFTGIRKKYSLRGGSYIVTSDVHLIHPVSNWEQELDAKLLVSHVDIGDYLTSYHRRDSSSFNNRRRAA